MLNNLNLLFFIMASFGAIISISSSNWFSAWMGLEINLISFIPFFSQYKNILSTESAMNYFLIQASASASFLFFCINNSLMNFYLFFNAEQISIYLIMIPLLIKLGSAPFHSWFVMIMQGLNWFSCYLVMTLQKIAPLFILAFSFKNKMVLIFSTLSLLVGSIGALNQTSLKKILSFSSINHLGWMLAILSFSKFLLTTYFLLYSFMNLFVLTFFNSNNLIQFNQISSKLSLCNLVLGILSLSGLPPLVGFLPKWMLLQYMIETQNILLSFFLVSTSLITLIFYLRLTYTSILLKSDSQKWILFFSKNTIFKMILVASSSLGLLTFNFFS